MNLCALFGQNLRRHRRAAGLTQEELAHRAGMDRTYLSDIERGIRNPTLMMMQDLATPLGIGVIDLLEGSGLGLSTAAAPEVSAVSKPT